MQLLEYRPGRYCWLDEAGKVVRRATQAEVRAELQRLAGEVEAPGPSLEGLPLFTAAAEGTIEGQAERRRKPAQAPEEKQVDAPPAMPKATARPRPAPVPKTEPPEAKPPQLDAPSATPKATARPRPAPVPKREPPEAKPPQPDAPPATVEATAKPAPKTEPPEAHAQPAVQRKARRKTRPTPKRKPPRTAPRQFDAQAAIPEAAVRGKAQPKPAPAPTRRKKQPPAAQPVTPKPAEPEPATPQEVLDTANLQAGDLVCSNCGEPWPGTFSGKWRQANGQWFHWCHGGRPGSWRVAELAEKKRGA